MDVNGTRFHVLAGAGDWARCTVTGPATIALSDSVSLRPLLLQLPPRPDGATSDPVDRRRGAARDRYGNWYWVDDTRAIINVRSVGSNALSVFWPTAPGETGMSGDSDPTSRTTAGGTAPPARPRGDFGPATAPVVRAPCRFGGLAITEDHYLIVGTLDQPGLLVFDLHAGGRPRHVRWPQGVPFQPFDLAPRPGGGVFVLDRDNRCYWALDRQLGVLDPVAGPATGSEAFAPASGQPDDLRGAGTPFPQGITIGAASALGAGDPVAIEALPDGTVLILDRSPRPTVYHHRLAQLLGSATLDLSGVLDPAPAGPPALGADLAFVAATTGARGDRLYVPAANGGQAFAFTIAWSDGPLTIAADLAAPFLPMRLFGGRGLVSTAGQVWYDFSGKSWVPLIEQRRPRCEREGSFDSPAFDGVEPGCVWHRLFIDGALPATATIEVWSRVADELADLPRAPWSPEPTPQRRASGRELPFASQEAGAGGGMSSRGHSSSGSTGTFELLFQRARGRWMQLHFRLRGDGRSSPKLRALRVWYPRFSYLAQYLPAVYRDDAESASFLDRFLANLEGLFTSVEDAVAVARLLFDARTAPAETLDWLAGWFGVALDPAWTEAKQRLFLRHAMSFFRTRGTMRGLRTALRLVLDDCPDDSLFDDDRAADAPASVRILEWYRLRSIPALALGDPDAPAGIRQMSLPPAWTPEQGGAALLALYRAATSAGGLAGTVAAFPVYEPTDGSAPLWHAFLRDVLSLSSTAGPDQSAPWQTFLAARYATVDALNAAWKEAFTAVSAVPLPASLPPDGAPLADWYQFQLGAGRFVPSRSRWIPSQGRDVLLDRWRQQLHAAGITATGDFPVSDPADTATADLWAAFTSDVLGFVPGSGLREQQGWRDFLARRYRRIVAYNLAYAATASSFVDLTLPAALPADGASLRDWYDFQSLAIGIQRGAHRFTVLLPVPPQDAFALDKHQQRRDLARRIVDLEKPAHTLFDVKFYWAMFRVGEARLAIDTLLDQGSRAPELMPPAVLGQAFLAETRLVATPPEREQERPILGSAALRSRTPREEKRS